MSSNIVHNEFLKLNLGCGLNAPPGWVNIDASFTARLSKWRGLYNAICKVSRTKPIRWPKNIKIADVRKGLPFSSGTVKMIFSFHMLEHMTYEEANFVIKKCCRCLCGGYNTDNRSRFASNIEEAYRPYWPPKSV